MHTSPMALKRLSYILLKLMTNLVQGTQKDKEIVYDEILGHLVSFSVVSRDGSWNL